MLLVVAEVALCSGSDECPTWFINTTDGCKCGDSYEGTILCDQTNEIAYIFLGQCVGHTSNNGNRKLVTGGCHFVNYKANTSLDIFYMLPQNSSRVDDDTCGLYHREGLFCGKCMNGFGPSSDFFTLKCGKCSNYSSLHTVGFYLVFQIFPITVLYVIIVVFRINLVSGPLLGYIIFCQYCSVTIGSATPFAHFLYSSLSYAHYDVTRRFIHAMISVSSLWNFDFHALIPWTIPYCFEQNSTIIIKVFIIQYITVMAYPLLLIFMTILAKELHASNFSFIVYLWKPFHKWFYKVRKNLSVSDSIIHAFATFLMLSFAKLVFLSYAVFASTYTYDMTRKASKTVLLFDPNIERYKREHAPYVAVATVLLFVLGFCPAVLLCLYPTRLFGKVLRCCNARKRIAIDTFVETLQGAYKNGLNGTRDFRTIPAMSILIILAYIAYHAFFPILTVYGPRNTMLPFELTAISLCLCYLKPFKSSLINLSVSFHVSIMAFIAGVTVLWLHDTLLPTLALAVTLSILVSLPHFIVLFCIVYKVIGCIALFKKCITHVKRNSEAIAREALWRYENRDLEESLPDRLVNSTQYQNLSPYNTE